MSPTVFYDKKEIIPDNLKIEKIMPKMTVFVLDGTVLVVQDVYGHMKNVYYNENHMKECTITYDLKVGLHCVSKSLQRMLINQICLRRRCHACHITL